MSKDAKSPESKATWDGMAAKWILFAESADHRYSLKVNPTPRHRQRSRFYPN